MINIQINNMLRIDDADIQLIPGKVTGVTGMNATGKTSLAILTAALLTGEDNPAGGKANQKVYLQDSAESGEARINVNDEPVARWNAVSGEMSVFESSFVRPSKETVGMVDFCGQMTQPQKIALWEGLFLPPKEVLNEKFEQQLKPHINENILAEIMQMVREEDIDVVFKTYQARARASKRDWMRITGETWGVAKGADWLPDDWSSALDGLTVKKLEEKLGYQNEELRALHVDQAISRADVERAKQALERIKSNTRKLDDMREIATAIKADLNSAEKAKKDIDARLSAARSRVSLLKAERIIPEKNVLECPVCAATLIHAPNGLVIHDHKNEELQKRDHEDQVRKYTGRLDTIIEESREWNAKFGPLKRKFEGIVDQARKIKAESEALQQVSRYADEEPVESNRDAIEKMETEIEKTKAQISPIQAREAASNIHDTITAYLMIMDIVGPKGVRATCMEENMAKFDNLLKTVTDLTGWPRVKLDRTYAISIGDRTFLKLCAKSEVYRAQFTIQLAISRFIRSPVVILDEVNNLDILHQVALKDLMNAVCGRKDPPAFMICGKELDLAHINPDGINYKMVNGKAVDCSLAS